MDLIVIRNFAIALFIGALVGIDREKHKVGEADNIGGIRTFILFAAAGAVSGWLGTMLRTPWIFIVTVAAVAIAVTAAYVVHSLRSTNSGLTTEIAAVVVCMLGGLATYGEVEIAVALGIATSAILAFKEPIHGLVEKIGPDDLYAGLKLLIATFIVLPLLPREAVDPLGALEPYRLWLLVILISALSLVGYVAVRVLGSERGTAVTGLFGGLVSSTAVTLAFARTSQGDKAERLANALAAGVLLSWVIMFGRVGVEVAVVHPALLGALAGPMTAMGLASLGFAIAYLVRGTREARDTHATDVPLSNPFRLTSAIKFAGLFAVVLVLVKVVEQYLPVGGFYVVAGLAGLTDVDAITLSMATFARDGGSRDIAVGSIVTAALSNTLVKGGLVAALGAPALRRRVGIGVLTIIAAGVTALLVT